MAVTPTRREERAATRAEQTTMQQERQPRYGLPFFPSAIFGSAFFILATAVALFFLAVTNPAPLQNPADPLNHEHVNPRPEWYFLFLFQILKIFQGPLEIVGTAIIPGLIGLVLLGLPFYDRNWSRRAARRPVAVFLASATILGLAYLTYIPIHDTAIQQQAGGGPNLLGTVSRNPSYTNIQAIFNANCSQCHIAITSGGLRLDSYANVMKGGTGGGPVVGPVVKPGDPMASYLYLVVEGIKQPSMPLGGPLISKVDRQNIYNWIRNGAKNQ
jgi:hypothetical protein